MTNRAITPAAETAFLRDTYKYSDQVTVTILPLAAIATALASSTHLETVLGVMGFAAATSPRPLNREMALSNVLLLGSEATVVREAAVAAMIKANLAQHGSMPQQALLQHLDAQMGIPGMDVLGPKAVDKCRSEGTVQGPQSAVRLVDGEKMRVLAQITDQDLARSLDIASLEREGCAPDKAENLLNAAVELAIWKGADSQRGAVEDRLSHALADAAPDRAGNAALQRLLPALLTVQRMQYGTVVAEVFSTDTFDIYRALGARDEMQIVLDTSVAMPLVLGLESGFVRSRYSQSAKAIHSEADRHKIALAIPNSYINEIASHGRSALEYHETYESLPAAARLVMSGASNAFVSHHAALAAGPDGSAQSLPEFLRRFGIVSDRSLTRIENTLAEIIAGLGMSIIRTKDTAPDPSFLREIQKAKQNEHRVLVTHDAEVVTRLYATDQTGYILATWDYVMRQVVAGTNRILASNPALICDLLATTNSATEDTGRSINLAVALIHIDELKTQELAAKIERIKSPEAAQSLRAIVDEARLHHEANWQPDPAELDRMVSQLLGKTEPS